MVKCLKLNLNRRRNVLFSIGLRLSWNQISGSPEV